MIYQLYAGDTPFNGDVDLDELHMSILEKAPRFGKEFKGHEGAVDFI
jgi:hypothetical protein